MTSPASLEPLDKLSGLPHAVIKNDKNFIRTFSIFKRKNKVGLKWLVLYFYHIEIQLDLHSFREDAYWTFKLLEAVTQKAEFDVDDLKQLLKDTTFTMSKDRSESIRLKNRDVI